MREFHQTVQIERHRLPNGALALTYTDPTESTARPLVFVLHGLGSRKERHLDLCLRLAQSGYHAVAPDAPHHGERATWEAKVLLDDRTHPEYADMLRVVVQETVREISLFADYFGAEQLGLIGHSMGGFIALQSALIEPRAGVVVNVAGSLDLTQPIQQETSPIEKAKRMIEAEQFDPAINAHRLHPRPILLIHGEQDMVVPIAGANRLFAALQANYADAPQNVALQTYLAGHELNSEMAARAVEWIRAHLPHD